jgi:hypothetical protein
MANVFALTETARFLPSTRLARNFEWGDFIVATCVLIANQRRRMMHASARRSAWQNGHVKTRAVTPD